MSHMSLFGPRYSWACLNEAIVCGREGPGIGGNRSQRGPTPATSQLQRLHALPLHVAEETTTNQFSNEIVPGIPGFPRSAALWKTPDTEWERRGMTGQEGGREGGGTYWRTVTGQYEKNGEHFLHHFLHSNTGGHVDQMITVLYCPDSD